jgi:hypothetical protein
MGARAIFNGRLVFGVATKAVRKKTEGQGGYLAVRRTILQAARAQF